MERISTYDVSFKNLSEGLHEFEYEINDKFFELFENSLVEAGAIVVKLGIERRSSFIKLLFKLSGYLTLECDRCLDNYDQPIDYSAELFVKFGEEEYEDGDNVIWLVSDNHLLNLAHLIYEFVVLSIPIKHVHPKDKNGKGTCNKEMIKKIKSLSVNDEQPKTDERWDALKGLLNNN